MLKRFGHYDSKPSATPFDPNCKLKKNMGDSVSQLEYSRVIRSLMYITNCTRPDIAYFVNRLARYTNIFTRYPSVIEGFSDANWISDNMESI